MKNLITTLLLVVFLNFNVDAQKSYSVVSPNGKLKAEITVGELVEYSLSHAGDQLLNNSTISMTLTNGVELGANSRVLKSKTRLVKNEIEAINYKKNIVTDNYNELEIFFRGNFSLIFRAYNDGLAYRFSTNMKESFYVKNEQVVFNFPDNLKAFIPYVNNGNGQKDTFEIGRASCRERV